MNRFRVVGGILLALVLAFACMVLTRTGGGGSNMIFVVMCAFPVVFVLGGLWIAGIFDGTY